MCSCVSMRIHEAWAFECPLKALDVTAREKERGSGVSPSFKVRFILSIRLHSSLSLQQSLQAGKAGITYSYTLIAIASYASSKQYNELSGNWLEEVCIRASDSAVVA